MQSDHTIPGLFDDGKVAEREQYHLRFLKTFLVNRLSQVFPMFAEESIYQFEELLKEAEDQGNHIIISPPKKKTILVLRLMAEGHRILNISISHIKKSIGIGK